MSASNAVLSRMQLTLHAIRPAPLGASNLVQAMFALVGENPTCSVPALQRCERLRSYDYGHARHEYAPLPHDQSDVVIHGGFTKSGFSPALGVQLYPLRCLAQGIFPRFALHLCSKSSSGRDRGCYFGWGVTFGSFVSSRSEPVFE